MIDPVVYLLLEHPAVLLLLLAYASLLMGAMVLVAEFSGDGDS